MYVQNISFILCLLRELSLLGTCKRNVYVNGLSVQVLKINRGNVSVCVS